MSQIILSINAGSSSLSCSLYKAIAAEKKLEKLAGGEVSTIGTEKAHFKYTRAQDKQETDLDDVQDHKKAFEYILDAFLNDKSVAVTEKDDIKYACHRVVQGGDFRDDEVITRETFHKIEALSDLGPLHNASAVQLMTAIQLPTL